MIKYWMIYAAYGLIAGSVLVGMGEGFSKWMNDKPEWVFYEQLVDNPLVQVTGPNKPIFGYLPGFKSLMVFFVETEPIGYCLFVVLNGLACLGIVRIIYLKYTHTHPTPQTLLWLAICSTVPIWFALQNNQVVAPAVLLTLYAFSQARHRQQLVAGVLIAGAILIKTLPLPILMFPLVLRQWAFFFSALITIVFFSFGGAVLTDGITNSIKTHLKWPSQVSAQNPINTMASGQLPRSFPNNQSPAAEAVRIARLTESDLSISLYMAIAASTLVVLIFLSVYGVRDDNTYWSCLAGWLAWVGFAAPFGRYYYLLFFTPAIYDLGLYVIKNTKHHTSLYLGLLAILNFSLLGARPKTLKLYAIAACLVLCFHLWLQIKCYLQTTKPLATTPETVPH